MFCLKAAELVLGRRQDFVKHRLSVSSLSPWTLGQHSCSFPWSWIKPLSCSSCWSSSSTRGLISAFRHDKDFHLFINFFPAANRSASPCFTLICLYNHPCCLDEGLISMLEILLCAKFLYSSWNFEEYIMMLINSFLEKRIIASIGSNFINVGNESK